MSEMTAEAARGRETEMSTQVSSREDIVLEEHDGVLIVTLANPSRRNALTDSMRVGLCDALALAEREPTVKVVILTGIGNAFCSGADLEELNARAERSSASDAFVDMSEHPDPTGRPGGFDFPLLFWGLTKPTIAAVNGPAMGAGFGLMMCCDLRIASTRAMASSTFARMGLSCEYGLSFVLPRVVGAARAFEILYTARRYGADDLLRMGLVNSVVPPEDLLDEAMRLADEIACIPAVALRRIRMGVQRGMVADDFRHQIEYEAYLQSLGLMSNEHREATRTVLAARRQRRNDVQL